MPTILCHAGAWNTADRQHIDADHSAVKEALQEAKKSKSMIDAVEAAIVSLENNPALDAGLGSIIQMDGRIRMDSAMADSDGRYGSIIQIEEIQNPIRVARKLFEMGYHHILSGEGAKAFALEQGFPRKSAYTEARLKAFLGQRHEVPELSFSALVKNKEAFDKKKLSTVGVVACDEKGNLIAATSTGGLSYGYPGRVGDSALLGHGIYCSREVAVACTGHGEVIIRIMMSRRVEDYYKDTQDIQKSVDRAIADLGKAGGQGGIIAIDRHGKTAVGTNTSFLATAEQTF